MLAVGALPAGYPIMTFKADSGPYAGFFWVTFVPCMYLGFLMYYLVDKLTHYFNLGLSVYPQLEESKTTAGAKDEEIVPIYNTTAD